MKNDEHQTTGNEAGVARAPTVLGINLDLTDDPELQTMNCLADVMRFARAQYPSLDDAAVGRIVDWFYNRYTVGAIGT